MTRAIALLEPWFSGNHPLTGALETHFDELMTCYLELSNARKRERLVALAIEHGDKALRSIALQRRAMMLADRGDRAGAWQVFADAQPMDPDNPCHALLELTLLMSEGRSDQARERASFWLTRLERMRDPALAKLIKFVRTVRDNPSAVVANIERERIPGIARLEDLFAAVPEVTAHQKVKDQGEGERMLAPDVALRALEERWAQVFPQGKPSLTATHAFHDEMWDEPEPWLDFLAQDPLTWQSFDVLDDLVLAVDALQTLGTGPTILEPLLARGVAQG